MKLNDNFSKVFEQIQTLKKPAAPGNTTPAPSPESVKAPETKAPSDSVKQTEAKQGKATANLGLFDSRAVIQEWGQASRGDKLPLPSKPDDAFGSLNSLMNQIKESPRYSDKQKQTFKNFLQDYSMAGKEGSPLAKTNNLRLLEDLLDNRGITRQQLDMIMDGSFTSENLLQVQLENNRVMW